MKKEKSNNLESTGFVNNIEIRFYGIMRSGNHALINWIMEQYGGKKICFLNNISPLADDPYINSCRREIVNIKDVTDIEALRNTHKHLLFFSFEDRKLLQENDISLLHAVFDSKLQANRRCFTLPCRSSFDIGVIRDPYNCFASRMKLLDARGACGGADDMNFIKENWKEIARKAVKLSTKPDNHDFIISFNRWLISKTYRQEISKRLMGVWKDFDLFSVSDYGGGSSFETTKSFSVVRPIRKHWKKVFNFKYIRKLPLFFKQLKQPMLTVPELMSRWKIMADNKEFQDLFKDQEVVELSNILFGQLEGISEFLEAIK